MSIIIQLKKKEELHGYWHQRTNKTENCENRKITGGQSGKLWSGPKVSLPNLGILEVIFFFSGLHLDKEGIELDQLQDTF